MKKYLFVGGIFLTVFAPYLVNAAVFTANEGSQSLTVFSGVDGKDKPTQIALPAMPHNVQAVPERRIILVTGMLMGAGDHAMRHSDSGELMAIDSHASGKGLLWQLQVGEHPAHVVADNGGHLAYVTLTGEDRVAVIDLAGQHEVASIRTGLKPHGIRLSGNGEKALVANMDGGSVSLLDTRKRKPITTIKTGGHPIQTAISYDGSVGYVSLAGTNELVKLDLINHKVLRRFALEKVPAQVWLTRHYVLVAQQGSQNDPGKVVSFFSLENPEKRFDITVGRGPHGLVADVDEKFAYITNVYDATVSVIDLDGLNVIKTIKVGLYPNGITYILPVD